MNVLFISHSAGLTGAPILLLELTRTFVTEYGIRPSFLLSEDGPLRSSLEELGPVSVRRTPRLGTGRRFMEHRGLGPLSSAIGTAVAPTLRHLTRDVDLIYSNTLVNGAALEMLPDEIPLLCHAHELRTFLNTHVAARTLVSSLRADAFVTPSHPVLRMLTDDFHVPAERCHLIEQPLPSGFQTYDAESQSRRRRRWRSRNAIDQDAFVVGGVGTIDPRKGTDLFVQLALLLREHVRADQEKVFVWMGAAAEPRFAKWLEHDLNVLTLNGPVRFLGPVRDPLDVYDGMDVLALTSREDPYPLAMLEAAARNRPVVAFRDSGGAEDFVRDSAGGQLVDYLNVPAMAEAVEHYLAHPDERRRDGTAGGSFVRSDRTVARCAAQIWPVMQATA